jgi:hypothetical protein
MAGTLSISLRANFFDLISCLRWVVTFACICHSIPFSYIFDPSCFTRQQSSSKTQDKAWIQKERLLRFDREFARRTEIFDDQADYQNPTTWMSEEERQEADENKRKHLERMKRPKQTLNLNIS